MALREEIIYKRKKGYTLLDICKFNISYNPHLTNLIVLCDTARICFEEGLPFTRKQIKKVFDKYYSKELYGTKQGNLEFINKWSGSKIIKFVTESPQGIKKVPSAPLKNNLLSSQAIENKNKDNLPTSSLNRGLEGLKNE